MDEQSKPSFRLIWKFLSEFEEFEVLKDQWASASQSGKVSLDTKSIFRVRIIHGPLFIIRQIPPRLLSLAISLLGSWRVNCASALSVWRDASIIHSDSSILPFTHQCTVFTVVLIRFLANIRATSTAIVGTIQPLFTGETLMPKYEQCFISTLKHSFNTIINISVWMYRFDSDAFPGHSHWYHHASEISWQNTTSCLILCHTTSSLSFYILAALPNTLFESIIRHLIAKADLKSNLECDFSKYRIKFLTTIMMINFHVSLLLNDSNDIKLDGQPMTTQPFEVLQLQY